MEQHKMKLTEKIYDISTGEETITERDETADETKVRLAREKALKDDADLREQRALDRAALLSQLGITEEQAKLLLG
jgi:hypothetical protein